MALPWYGHGIAMAMPWPCQGNAMAMPWQCHGNDGNVMVAMVCHGIPWRTMVYHGIPSSRLRLFSGKKTRPRCVRAFATAVK